MVIWLLSYCLCIAVNSFEAKPSCPHHLLFWFGNKISALHSTALEITKDVNMEQQPKAACFHRMMAKRGSFTTNYCIFSVKKLWKLKLWYDLYLQWNSITGCTSMSSVTKSCKENWSLSYCYQFSVKFPDWIDTEVVKYLLSLQNIKSCCLPLPLMLWAASGKMATIQRCC